MKGYKTVGFEHKDENENEYTVPLGLKQYFTVVQDEFRLMHLLAFIFHNTGKKVIVFASTCDTVNLIELFLKGFRFLSDQVLFQGKVYKLHGKMKHNERKVIFKDFNKNEPGILICTDVVARGLDFPLVDWIVHYDINPDPKDYLNRMGRTARLDQTGNSILFLMDHERKIIDTCLSKFKIEEYKPSKILLSFVKSFNEYMKSNDQKRIEEAQRHQGGLEGEEENITPFFPIDCTPQPYDDEVDDNERYRKKYIFIIYPLQKAIKDFIFESRDNLILGKQAFKSSLKSYGTFLKYQKDVFNVKNINLSRYVSSNITIY